MYIISSYDAARGYSPRHAAALIGAAKAARQGELVTLVCQQTRYGAYSSLPSLADARALAAAELTGGGARWTAHDEILRPYYDNAHGEGARNLEALANLLMIGVEPVITVEEV